MKATDCLEQVRETVRRHQLLAAGDTVLVAVSGGGDSVALLALLCALRAELGISLHVVHLNHRLRSEADDDAAFVQDLAATFHVPVTIESSDVRALAINEKRSLEDAGRTARYAFFARVASRLRAGRVATAHTRDDQAETVLMRLWQGAAWEALAGIPPVRPLGEAMVIRPLCELTRAELIGHLREQGLRWREDATNCDRRVVRNRIRHDILPVLERQHLQLRSLLWRVGETVRHTEQFLQDLTQAAWDRMARRHGTTLALPLQEFHHFPRAVQRRFVHRAVEAVAGWNRPVPRVIEEEVVRLGVASRPGTQVDLGVCLARCGYEMLEFLPYPPAAPEASYMLPVPGRVTAEAFGIVVAAELAQATSDQGPSTTPEMVDLDAAAIGTPLQVRPWRPGDWFRPRGLGGKKKLQDFFVDAKIPRWNRAFVPMLIDARGQIAWVIGHRVAETAQVTAATTRVARIRVTPIPLGRA